MRNRMMFVVLSVVQLDMTASALPAIDPARLLFGDVLLAHVPLPPLPPALPVPVAASAAIATPPIEPDPRPSDQILQMLKEAKRSRTTIFNGLSKITTAPEDKRCVESMVLAALEAPIQRCYLSKILDYINTTWRAKHPDCPIICAPEWQKQFEEHWFAADALSHPWEYRDELRQAACDFGFQVPSSSNILKKSGWGMAGWTKMAKELSYYKGKPHEREKLEEVLGLVVEKKEFAFRMYKLLCAWNKTNPSQKIDDTKLMPYISAARVETFSKPNEELPPRKKRRVSYKEWVC